MLDFVFIVLVYKNTSDLQEFFKSCPSHNSKVIVVNSYYDNYSELIFRNIAKENGADFFSVENKGYGYGNNQGILYALKKYSFKYLVISNADIQIDELKIESLKTKEGMYIYAPEITTLKGKKQNPYLPYDSDFSYKVLKICYDNNWLHFRKLVFAIRRLIRELFLLFSKNTSRIYAAHGSFIIFNYDSINYLKDLFCEDMFLFMEEDHLAKLAKKHKIDIYYNNLVKITHKEDGSINITFKQTHTYKIIKKSFFVFYQNWF